MKKILNWLEETTPKIMKKEFKPLVELEPSLPKNGGVYIIKRKTDEKIIYVGRTQNLRRRMRQYLSDSDNMRQVSLKRKLHKKSGLNAKQQADYFKNKCLFIVEEIGDFKGIKDFFMYDLMERFLIAIYKKDGQPLENTES